MNRLQNELIDKWEVAYIVIGDREKHVGTLILPEEFYLKVAEFGSVEIYQPID